MILFLIALLIIIASIIYHTFAWGYVCLQFWYWFILPAFPDLPHLNLWHCIGLMFFITLFKNNAVVSYKKEEGKEVNDVIATLLTPWITLFVASFFNQI